MHLPWNNDTVLLYTAIDFDYCIDIYAWQTSGLEALQSKLKRAIAACDPERNIPAQV